MRKLTKRSVAIIAASVVAVGGAGAAWAYWISTGTTSEFNFNAGGSSDLLVDTVSVEGGPLVPGNPVDVKFNVTNRNEYPVKLTDFEIKDFVVPSNCTASTFVINPTKPTFTGVLQPGDNTTNNDLTTITWTDAIRVASNPDDRCKAANIKFKIKVTANNSDSSNTGTNPGGNGGGPGTKTGKTDAEVVAPE